MKIPTLQLRRNQNLWFEENRQEFKTFSEILNSTKTTKQVSNKITKVTKGANGVTVFTLKVEAVITMIPITITSSTKMIARNLR